MSNNLEKGAIPEKEEEKTVVYQFNDQIGDFEELIIDEDLPLYELLDPSFILLIVDPKRFRVWVWHGSNTTTRMKFIAAKMAPSIRDKHGIAFKITAVDEENEMEAFKILVGQSKEEEYDDTQTGPAYSGTDEDLELLETLSREKILLLLEKAGIPEGYERKMVIVKNKIFGYREYKRNYLGSIIDEKQLFPLKEEIEDGTYLAEEYVPRMLFSYNNVVLTELLQKVEEEEIPFQETIDEKKVPDQDKVKDDIIKKKKVT